MKDSKEITDLKVKLYDVIESQAVLQAQHQQLEQQKAELAKKLGEARQATAQDDE